MLGDDIPNDELNHLKKVGENFGFPYCYDHGVPDPQFNRRNYCDTTVHPAFELGAHVASLGMKFYTGTMFPADYRNRIFIAEHGSWNRSRKVGYRVVDLVREGDRVVRQEVFAEGWLQPGDSVWGRPVDILVMPDGSLLVSDDMNGCIYRIWYEK